MPGQPVNRWAIKQALLDLGQQVFFPWPIQGWSTWASPGSRKLKTFNEVDPSLQPTFFLTQHREGYLQYGVGRLTRRYLDMGFWCLAKVNGDEVGDDFLDSMESGLEAALAPDDLVRNELTLGGLCYWCRIMREDNLFIRDPGDLDGQALLHLPVRILLP